MITFEEYVNKLDKTEEEYQEAKRSILESKDFQKKFLEDLSSFLEVPIKEIRINSECSFSDDIGCYNEPYVDHIVTKAGGIITNGLTTQIEYPEGVRPNVLNSELGKLIEKDLSTEDVVQQIYDVMNTYIIDHLDHYNYYFHNFVMKM